MTLIALAFAVLAISAVSASAEPTYIRPLDARHSPFVGGNRSPRLPSGQQGRLSVVAKGVYDGSLPIIVRNNTSRTVNGIYVTGLATSASGRILATGDSQGFHPSLVKPGEITIGYVFFRDAQLPPNARYRLSVAENRSTAQKDLVMTKASFATDRVIGIARNPRATEASLPAGTVACFVGNRLLDTYEDPSDQITVRPHGTLIFQVEVFDACPTFLVTAYGV
jgi:hypothetical protein